MLRGNLKEIRLQDTVQTNILMLDLTDAGICAEEFCDRAKKMGLLIRGVHKPTQVRLVLYKGITVDDSVKAANIILRLDAELANGI